MIFAFHSLCMFMCYAYKLITCRRQIQHKNLRQVLQCDSAMEKKDSDDIKDKIIVNNTAPKDDKSVATDPDWSNEPIAASDREEKDLKFIPPVYVQRYAAVLDVLQDSRWKEDIKKVCFCTMVGIVYKLSHRLSSLFLSLRERRKDHSLYIM